MIHHKTIYQTNKALVPESINKWNAANRPDRWDVHFFDDWQGDRWVRDTFNGTVIQWAWSYMTRPVLRADFLRYMLPLVNGGVYVDIDVSTLVLSAWVCTPIASPLLTPLSHDPRLLTPWQSCLQTSLAVLLNPSHSCVLCHKAGRIQLSAVTFFP